MSLCVGSECEHHTQTRTHTHTHTHTPGVTAIARALAFNRTLRVLQLRGNPERAFGIMGDRGVTSLFDELRVNQVSCV